MGRTPHPETTREVDECITYWSGEALNRIRGEDQPVEALVDTGAEVSMLGTEQYSSLGCKTISR